MAKMLSVIFIVFISSSAANNDVNNDIVGQSEMKNGTNSTQGNRGDGERGDGRNIPIFNVISFPNSPCAATSGFNGTCYTASECTSKGGTSGGSCASSFGVCCVFSLACGSTSSENNTYAIMSAYSTSSDADPCVYTFCRSSSDVCKLRLDFETMVLAAPFSISATSVLADGKKTGDCLTDTFSVSNPGGNSPPVICGTNTGQHMFVPASSLCNDVNINVDTGSTVLTRQWQIKVTQYECGSEMAPEQECLQYHTASTGTLATFNWDFVTSATAVAAAQTHLSSQEYAICIRRARSYCSICYTPQIHNTGAALSSFGLSASSNGGPTVQSAVGTYCTGNTVIGAAIANNIGQGDYIEIVNLQTAPGTSGTVSTIGKVCGSYFNVASGQTTHITMCSFSTPFKIQVHTDANEAIGASPIPATDLDHSENHAVITGSGSGYQGFYLAYFQNSC